MQNEILLIIFHQSLFTLNSIRSELAILYEEMYIEVEYNTKNSFGGFSQKYLFLNMISLLKEQ